MRHRANASVRYNENKQRYEFKEGGGGTWATLQLSK